jgi:phosphoribosyl 1,2-cyclic phosphodiesterase
MPLSLFVLASGSRSNAIVISGEKTRILIDAGLSLRAMTQALAECGLKPEQLTALFITHEHSDHIRGLERLLSRTHMPVYASEGTLNFVDYMVPARCTATVMNGQAVEVGEFVVHAVKVPHDASGPLAYHIECGGHRVTVATDLGEVPTALAKLLKHSTCAVLESNHDVDMLRNGSYPELLKDRILSGNGHLSNAQCADALTACRGNGLRTVVLAHISDENNDPELARTAAAEALSESGVALHVTSRMAIGPFLNLEA